MAEAWRLERDNPDYGRGPSPYSKPEEQGGSPNYGRAESPAYDRHRSRSPSPARLDHKGAPNYGRAKILLMKDIVAAAAHQQGEKDHKMKF